MNYLIAAETDIGIRNDTNQDSLMIRIADSNFGKILFAVICDGMGGYEKGELASKTAVEAFSSWFQNEFPSLLRQGVDVEHLKENLTLVIQRISTTIMEYGNNHGIHLGTTISAFLILQGKYYIIHVGDCRIYEIKNTLKCLTKDQTVLARELESGNITSEMARNDKRKHILLQSVGASDMVVPFFCTGNAEMDAAYLMCSDGFCHEILDEEIVQYFNPQNLNSVESMRQSARELINLNMQRKEKDNISVALIRTYEES